MSFWNPLNWFGNEKSEPVKSEPVKSEPVKSEPVKSEPASQKETTGNTKDQPGIWEQIYEFFTEWPNVNKQINAIKNWPEEEIRKIAQETACEKINKISGAQGDKLVFSNDDGTIRESDFIIGNGNDPEKTIATEKAVQNYIDKVEEKFEEKLQNAKTATNGKISKISGAQGDKLVFSNDDGTIREADFIIGNGNDPEKTIATEKAVQNYIDKVEEKINLCEQEISRLKEKSKRKIYFKIVKYTILILIFFAINFFTLFLWEYLLKK